MIRHIRSREELIEFVIDHAPSNAAARRARGGFVKMLGGFRLADGLTFIVQIEGEEQGKSWIVAATLWADMTWRVAYLIEVPWTQWMGSVKPPRRPLIDGDDPAWSFTQCINAREVPLAGTHSV